MKTARMDNDDEGSTSDENNKKNDLKMDSKLFLIKTAFLY